MPRPVWPKVGRPMCSSLVLFARDSRSSLLTIDAILTNEEGLQRSIHERHDGTMAAALALHQDPRYNKIGSRNTRQVTPRLFGDSRDPVTLSLSPFADAGSTAPLRS